MARVLSAAATEPSVLRWLHALDPDRNLSGELLQSSVRYSTRLDASEAVAPGMPRETASLFMPMYRRSSFVLGQLYGPMSPNTLALALLSAPAPPPTPRSRRFVVDLASEKPVEFVEYEWLSDGKLCISLHEIGHAGLYEGQTLVFGGPQSPGSPVPSNLVMTLDYREAALPDRPTDVIAADWRSQPVSWETWTVAFARLRSGSSAVTTKVTIPTPPNMNHPPFTKEFQTLLREECAVGEAGFQATSANKLVRMFLQAQGMFISHPAQDEAVMRRAEQRAFTDAVTGLYEEADDEPMEFPTGDAPMLLDSGVADPASASTALVHPEVHDAARLLDEELMRNPPAPVPEFEAQPTSWNAEIASSASVSPLGTDESGDSSPGSPKAGSQAGRAAETSGTPSGASGASAPAVLDVETKPKRPAAPREHVCECGIRFLHRGHFNAHRRAVHEKIRPHICSYRNCESAFAKRSDLLRHQLSQHSEDVRFACSQCSVSFPDKAQLALHFSSLHDQFRPFKCLYCARSYSTRSGLRKHNINKHADECTAANAAAASAAAALPPQGTSAGAGPSGAASHISRASDPAP